MKIGFVTTTYPRYEGDGAGVFISEQVNALRRLGHDVKVIAPEFEGEPHGDAFKDVIRVKFKPRSARKISYGDGIWPNLKKNPLLFLAIPGFIKSFEKTIRKEFADREVIEAVFTAAGKALIKARRPSQAIVYAGHGSDIHLMETSAIYRKQFEKILKQFDGITVVSKYLANKLKNSFPEINPVVIPNGLNDDVFNYSNEWRSEPTAIYASRMIPLKRTDMLVSAWAKVAKEVPNARLILFGDGPLLPECNKIVKHERLEESVIFEGKVPQKELWDEISRGWLTILPSKREGFPMPLVESLACGCPFISAPCGAAPEIAEKTGGGTIIEEPLTEDRIADAVVSCFKNYNKLMEMSEVGRRKVRELYSSVGIAKKKLDFYKTILDSSI